jgi:hypothetical protein
MELTLLFSLVHQWRVLEPVEAKVEFLQIVPQLEVQVVVVVVQVKMLQEVQVLKEEMVLQLAKVKEAEAAEWQLMLQLSMEETELQTHTTIMFTTTVVAVVAAEEYIAVQPVAQVALEEAVEDHGNNQVVQEQLQLQQQEI